MITKTLKSVFIFLFVSSNCFGYIHTISSKGNNVKWKNSSGNLDFYLNVNGCDSVINNCTSSTIKTIASSSASEWSSSSNFNITVNTTNSNAATGVNNIFFSSSSSYFGSGVVAVTQISYKESDGYILEADIIINSTFDFETNYVAPTYIGNVLTHEMGHMLGAAHGQVFRSSMFYTLIQGQHTLSDDDKSAVKNIYGLDSTLGTISGQIIGGSGKVAIFGAHVQAISSTTGSIKSATLSKEDGTFNLTNLSLDDIYYIYVGPTKLTTTTLPEYYKDIKSNFCNSAQSFRGSFFQTCNNSEKGEPQGIYLSSSRTSVNVGQVTIRCNLDVPVEYSVAKEVSAHTIDAIDLNGKVGFAQTAFFSTTEAENLTEDNFDLDLTAYSVASTDLYLEVRVVSQALYSQIPTSLVIENGIGSSTTFPQAGELGVSGVPYDSDFAPRLDLVGRFNLSTTLSDNNFTLKVIPQKFSDYIFAINNPTYYWSEEDFFPTSSKFTDGLKFYLLIVNIVKSNGNGTYSRYSMPTPTSVSDNSSCPDASRSYTTSGYYLSDSGAETTKTTKSNIAGCATIDIDPGEGPGGSGPMSFAIGVLLSYLIFNLRPRFNR